MDIKDLNKTQMVLLNILVAFVTAIATSIVVVSLLGQAPPSITRTINNVVERTVERVIPTIITGKPSITKETTIVVKDEDLITKSIEATKTSVVAIRSRAIGIDGLVANTFLGWGTIVVSTGVVATDISVVADDGPHGVVLEDGRTYEVKTVRYVQVANLALLQIQKGEKDTAPLSVAALKPADQEKLQLGTSVIAFGGKLNKKSINIGVLSSVVLVDIKQTDASSTPKQKVTNLEATVLPPSNNTGAPLINIFGEGVGVSMYAGIGERTASYIPWNRIVEEVSLIK